jgi:hypothetical protein
LLRNEELAFINVYFRGDPGVCQEDEDGAIFEKEDCGVCPESQHCAWRRSLIL